MIFKCAEQGEKGNQKKRKKEAFESKPEREKKIYEQYSDFDFDSKKDLKV